MMISSSPCSGSRRKRLSNSSRRSPLVIVYDLGRNRLGSVSVMSGFRVIVITWSQSGASWGTSWVAVWATAWVVVAPVRVGVWTSIHFSRMIWFWSWSNFARRTILTW